MLAPIWRCTSSCQRCARARFGFPYSTNDQPWPARAISPKAAPTGKSNRVPSLRIGNGSVMGDTPAAGFPEVQVWPKSLLDAVIVLRLKPDWSGATVSESLRSKAMP